MATDVSDWSAVLHALDEPAAPGQSAGLEVPTAFALTATQARFDRLVARLGEIYELQLAGAEGPQQDAARFGVVLIPPEVNRTRDERTGVGFSLAVMVSNFGSLATCVPLADSPVIRLQAVPPVHPEDRRRIEAVLAELEYRIVPAEVLEMPYEGPNQWVFGPRGATWFRRFFGFL